ncbi:MAG: cytochrome c maturation protein CcmE [Rhodospirillales bacterium]|nr:cytochrome c maturation protein CcmE [Rhodospirillales bacterium]
MKRKHRRLSFVALALLALGAAVALVMAAFEENIVFFFSPTEMGQKEVDPTQRLRLGGLVEEGSITKAADGVTVQFVVTDTVNTIPVEFRGILPDLFREGQGVVCEGRLINGVFKADEVLAKHDENYMPPEVAQALKDAEHWKEKMQDSKAE